jgi:hypothetical protein
VNRVNNMEYQCLPTADTHRLRHKTEHTSSLCYSVHFRVCNLCTATAEFILLAKEAETVDGAHASTHLTLFYDVFNMSLSFRRRARGKLRSRAFIFSSSSQHTVRSEFPSWWSCKYKNTKWTYLWNGIIHTFLQQWIKES